MPGTIDRRGWARAGSAALCAAAIALLALFAATPVGAAPIPTRTVYATGRIVPIPASIPHEEGDMVDRRIVPDLRWIASRYPIYVTDGYSGPLPSGARVGCNGCHVKHSDHYNGLAVDIVPFEGSPKCDVAWRPITRLARWAEPTQNRPRAPFRWVGYDGDAGHGCGNHLHLSWEHALAPMFELAEWVEVFPVRAKEVAQPPPTGPHGGAEPEATPADPTGPVGGISTVQSGGIGAGD
jgi:hypothetical protein